MKVRVKKCDFCCSPATVVHWVSTCHHEYNHSDHSKCSPQMQGLGWGHWCDACRADKWKPGDAFASVNTERTDIIPPIVIHGTVLKEIPDGE